MIAVKIIILHPINIWAITQDFGTYHIVEQTCKSLYCLHTKSMAANESSDQNSDR